MFLALLRGLVIPRVKTLPGKVENTFFVMSLMWKVANSKELGFQPLAHVLAIDFIDLCLLVLFFLLRLVFLAI